SESKYIDNKLLGDGFGFSQNEMALMQHLTLSSTAESQEWYMLTGAVHSGPISAIRYVGYVGLALYTWFLIVAARTAYRLVRKAQNTECFCPALFMCIPIIFEPFYYWVIFGAYDSSLPTAIYSAGLLKMLSNSLDDREKELERVAPSRRLPAQPRPVPIPA